MVLLTQDDGDWKERALTVARKHVDAAAKLNEDTGHHRHVPEIPELTALIDSLT